ncbi:MAG: PhoH family protein [Candidatus Auribacterota bacterium]|jgi:PhoH-like ATPase|nr:PhoH family protein [Candidatus Auribacterota bacterium]
MKKIFVLDTNVLLHNPRSLMAFEDNIVVLPIEVLEELDRFKKDHDEKGRNARISIRSVDKLREKGSLQNGIELENGGILQIVTSKSYNGNSLAGLPLDETDNRLIMTAYMLKIHNKMPVIFVSKDINARLKADALGIKSEDFESEKVDINELYTGWRTLTLDTYPEHLDNGIQWSGDTPLMPHEFVMIEEKNSPGKYEITKHDPATNKLYPLRNHVSSMWGVSPRNPQQVMAQELLLDTRIQLISLVGQAGTGKTLLALAAGLYMVVEKKVYDRLLISRPIMPLGRDIGYLPGSKSEKLENWMEPIFDNLEYVLSVMRKNSPSGFITMKDLIDNQLIQLEALTYMRGRSIPRQYIIIDEAQNLTPHEIKTVVSRCGMHAKMVLTGDPYQIDNPYLDSGSNGLTYCVDRMKEQNLFGHIMLQRSERSPLASLAAQLL